VEVADDDTATITAADLAELDELGDVELTSEEEYEQALDNEVEWNLLSDGILARESSTTWDGAWRRP
jgi:hypothetical protein